MNLNDLFNEEKVRLDPKCWTGKKIGNPKTKVKGGVRVNNCVPAESVAEANDPNFVGFMNNTLGDRVDAKPEQPKTGHDWYDNAPTMSMDNMPSYKHAFKFGMSVLQSMDAETKQHFAEADNDELFSYLMKLARKKGFEPKYFVEEDMFEVTGLFSEIFHDPSMQDWEWADLLRSTLNNQGVAEGKVKLYTDPSYFGAEVDDAGFDSLPVVNIPTNRLVGFEPDSKMQQPKAMANVKNILAGLEQGDNIPPILVRKYKNGYQVLDGHHRFWAYKVAKKDTIPARVVDPKDIEEVGKQGVAEAAGSREKFTDLKSWAAAAKQQGLRVGPANGDIDYDYSYWAVGKGGEVFGKFVTTRVPQNNHGYIKKQGVAEGTLDEAVGMMIKGAAISGANDQDIADRIAAKTGGRVDSGSYGHHVLITYPTTQHRAEAAVKIRKMFPGIELYKSGGNRNAIDEQGMAEGEQQKGADYRKPKEVDYDDEYDAMVARVKKLAGLGPMRTVYDPNKRVYRNIPTAQQPKK